MEPYATPAQVKMYCRVCEDNDMTDAEINTYTVNEDRFAIDVALKTGYRMDVPMNDVPEFIQVLSAKMSALAILKAYYNSALPSQIDFKSLENECTLFLEKLSTGELEI